MQDPGARDAQEVAENLLLLEMKRGALTKAMPTKQGARTDKATSSTKAKRLKEQNITVQEAHKSETIADHPEIVEEIQAPVPEGVTSAKTKEVIRGSYNPLRRTEWGLQLILMSSRKTYVWLFLGAFSNIVNLRKTIIASVLLFF